MPLKTSIVPVTAFSQNCSVLMCEQSKEIAVVDPGGDLDKILAAVDAMGGNLKKILLTHAHIDHAGATAELAGSRGIPIEGPHIDDQFWIDALPQQSQMFGFPAAEHFIPDRWLNDGDQVMVGEVVLRVFHCPGHTPGHLVFFSEEDKLALVGDVIFAGSIGRTDFPKGDHEQLLNSIRQKLWPLGDDIIFIPGHGPNSSFGEERRTNPFLVT